MMIGLAGLVLYPNIKASNVIPHIINELLTIGLKGFSIDGMLAVVMSTGDSYLHTAGLLLVDDVIRHIFSKIKISINELLWVQYITFLIGIISISIGLKSKNALD